MFLKIIMRASIKIKKKTQKQLNTFRNN